MSLSHELGSKGSKVARVALSAALAATFTPMAAIPAFANQDGGGCCRRLGRGKRL